MALHIEKLSDTQLKITLSQRDLDEHGIRPEELSASSAKTQGLFRDLMEQALEECDFPIENTPLMVEAVPSGTDGIMVIVTKLPGKDPMDIPQVMQAQGQKDTRRFKRTGFIDENESLPEVGDLYIYSFAALDDAAAAALRLHPHFAGQSALYKMENRYYLLLQGELSGPAGVPTILEEYGDRHPANILSRAYLSEHGESLIRQNAMEVLTTYLA